MHRPIAPDEPIKTISNSNLEKLFSQEETDSVNFLNQLIIEALNLNASDILLEPREYFTLVRIRTDGVLYQLGKINYEMTAQIASRIKVLCDLDITKNKKVQEGRFNIETDDGEAGLRVEVVQTVRGELIVCRIHEKKTIVMDLSELGFSEESYKKYHNMISQRSGLILTCGPTGCGKTTTLYSTINKININKSFNIMTIEDPVEYRMEGLNQMQTQNEKGFSFAAGLKTILRLSPDVVLVGEIRDKETAEIAVESGLTGQLVLSTIHAEDSIGGLFRLLDLHIEPYLLNSALTGIVAQRLVRKNCPACLETYEPNPEEKDLFQSICHYVPEELTRSKGCPECKNIGFKGRIGIYEVLKVTPRVRDLIRSKVNETELRNRLIEEGLITLLCDGLDKAAKGITTVDEVLRNSLRIA